MDEYSYRTFDKQINFMDNINMSLNTVFNHF